MSQSSILAESQVAQTPHDVVTVELVQPDDMPAIVKISWPAQSSIVDPKRFGDTRGRAGAHVLGGACRAGPDQSRRHR